MISVNGIDRRKTESSTDSIAATKEVAALAEVQLQRDGHLATQSVSCIFHDEVLILRGCVPTYYLKQIAQTVVMRIDGVGQVDNRIEVGASAGTRGMVDANQRDVFDGDGAPQRAR